MLVSRTFFRHDCFCVKSKTFCYCIKKSRILSLQEENLLLLLCTAMEVREIIILFHTRIILEVFFLVLCKFQNIAFCSMIT